MKYKIEICFHSKSWEKEFSDLLKLFFDTKKTITRQTFKFDGKLSSIKREKIILHTIRFFGVFEDAIKQSMIHYIKENTANEKLISYLSKKIDGEPIGFSSLKSVKDFVKKVVGTIKIESKLEKDSARLNELYKNFYEKVVQKMYNYRNDFAHKSLSTVSTSTIPSNQDITESFFMLVYIYSLVSDHSRQKTNKTWIIDTDANLEIFSEIGFIEKI